MSKLMISPVLRWARKLRPATLLKIAAALVCIDVVLPELIPFELLFGMGTLVLGNWSGRLFEGDSANVESEAASVNNRRRAPESPGVSRPAE